MNIETLLQQEIQRELEKLKEMEVGTEEYKSAVDGIAKLYDKLNEAEKNRNEREDKKASEKEDRVDRWVKNAIAIAGITIPTVVTVWGTLKSLKFEETGTVTTIMGRGFINKLLPKK